MEQTGKDVPKKQAYNFIKNITNMDVKDSNGNILSEGDTVTLTKDLKVKGSSITLKRGKTIKNIRLTNNPEEIDCRVDGSNIVLKTCFLKKG